MTEYFPPSQHFSNCSLDPCGDRYSPQENQLWNIQYFEEDRSNFEKFQTVGWIQLVKVIWETVTDCLPSE
jgi:hypothetical protein